VRVVEAGGHSVRISYSLALSDVMARQRPFRKLGALFGRSSRACDRNDCAQMFISEPLVTRD
jgi:hypothetical protein